MLASFVLDPTRRSHALAELARERLGIEMQTYVGLVGRGRGERPFAEVPVAVAARYCCADCEVVLRLRDAFQPELEDHQLLRLLETIEVPLIPVLVGMEWHGVLVDREVLGQISRQFARELAELEQTIHRAAGTDFNINSTPQLRHILFDKLQLLEHLEVRGRAGLGLLEHGQLEHWGMKCPGCSSSTASSRSSSPRT